MSDELAPVIAYLRSPGAIRARCEEIFAAGLAGKLAHFRIDVDALPRVVERVVAVTRRAFPDDTLAPEGTTTIDADALLRAVLEALAPIWPSELGDVWPHPAVGLVPFHELPMARVLEGATWAAGREVAAELRAGGPPPIRFHSDGAVF